MVKLSLISLAFLIFSNISVSSPYPSHWWKAVEDKNAPSWEILPQEGKKGQTVILSKRNDLGLLSNFAPTPIKYKGKIYASLEYFFLFQLSGYHI